ncbi:T9SS type A sorting domain-containing protein [Flavobacterium sp. GT3R68]|uniref:T9SS type A sorting domain-containing protein n=1 Tax=Flavobacterium sp. GT3R68 TaxID=2594437 RepID=UPI000F880944|nr:T9SS type A sorting domain-containing protein [Flavobacterium sp. GT3R68]RTY93465.1 T9SS type A sorting domain-containing protein [Flavobacterium sp. GSN2]TRW92362.1 T9SS type A sorting domain-containing protein [Flavobacterium sp. GT3R68]
MKRIKRLFLVSILTTTMISFAQDGTLDTTFDVDGKVVTLFGSNLSSVHDLAVQPDGKIIAGGSVFATSTIYNQFALARYNQDGSLDGAFGVGGKAVSDFSDLRLEFTAMAIQSDGKIVAVGSSHTFFNGLPYEQFEIMRFNSNGSIDTGFGVNGKVLSITIGDVSNMAAVIIQADGKIIVGGDTMIYSDPTSDFVVLRYLDNGVLDTGFGHNGVVITSLQADDVVKAMTLQADGKIILAGSSRAVYDPILGYYAQDFAVVRYNSNGSLDNTFGINGKLIAEGNEEFDTALLVESLADGTIIVAGNARPTGGPNNFLMMHLLPKGELDPDFGTGGVIIKPLSVGEVTAMEMQTDGKILLAQYHATGGISSADIQLIRFLATGGLDLTFGEDGIVTTDFINQNSQANAITVQDDGKILIGGGSGNPIHVDFAVSRFNSTLKLDNSEFNMAESFSVYPNPVQQTVNLTFTLKHSQLLSIDLYDTSGRKIIRLINDKTFAEGSNFQKLELPSTLSKGIYFLNISDGSKASVVKIVKE